MGDISATWRPFLHHDQRGEQRNDRLAGPDVALEQAPHRRRCSQVVDDHSERNPLIIGQSEWKDVARGPPDPIVDRYPSGRNRSLCCQPPAQQLDLERKELFENQPLLGRRPESVQSVERRARRRKVCGEQCFGPRRKVMRAADILR